MIRRHSTALRLALMAADAVSAVLVFVVISRFRFGAGWVESWTRAGLPAFVAIVGWSASWVLALWLHGLYRLRTHWTARAEMADVLRASLLVAITAFGGLFVVHLPEVSRLFLVMLFIAEFAIGLVSRLAIRGIFAIARTRGLSARYLLIVGTSAAAAAFADRMAEHTELGLRVIGHLGPRDDTIPLRRPILGSIDDIQAVLHERVIDEVAICLPATDWALVQPITHLCADEGKIVRLPGEPGGPLLAGASSESFDGMVVQSLVYGPDRTLSLLAKRFIDVLGATLLLVLTAPLTLAIAVAILVLDGRPILFRQRRIGLHGRGFQIVKFRTMVRDAEALRAELVARNEIHGPAFKIERDPRVSRVGGFLRRTSLDELPQLWNVIRGEMSLVGPRPPLVGEVRSYDVWHRRRLAMKPGITGLWQVSERRSPDFNRWVTMDLDYIDRWSLLLDLKILARTFPAMLEGR